MLWKLRKYRFGKASLEAKVDDISKNLIFCFNDETNKIDKIVLEIFHCKNKQLTYITIPMRTQLTMSDDLYRKMVLVQPDIPQVMQLSAISGYLDSNTVFDYGVLIIQELLGIDISYYTVIPKTIYDTIFTSKELTDTLPVETFSDEYMEFLKTIDTTEKLSTYIEELYPTLHSNLSLIDKMNYLESYAETSLSKISFQLIQGNDTNSSYIINRVLLTRQLERLTSVT